MAPKENTFDPAMLDDLLSIYYKKLFPHHLFCEWLGYGHDAKQYFAFREFSFTLKGDVYVRYQSFADETDFKNNLVRMSPHKIDIGAVYNHRPKDNKTVMSGAFQPQTKELVFDIDMTDYDDVRFCCSEADICSKCWPLMQFAVRILDRALREDFGFEHLLWVYSGRRGVHCWVCDEAARALSPGARSAIAEYLSIVKGGAQQVKKVNLGNNSARLLHPSVQNAIDLIEPDFLSYAAEGQEFLQGKSRVQQVLRLLPDDVAEQRDELLGRWSDEENHPVSVKRWNTLTKFFTKESPNTLSEIMLQYTYPRLDVHVTTGLNHLLKSPFCVHPKTGRICVPFDPTRVDEFDPFSVPTISQVIDELNTATSPEGGHHLHLYKQTALRHATQLFEAFVERVKVKGQRRKESDVIAEF